MRKDLRRGRKRSSPGLPKSGECEAKRRRILVQIQQRRTLIEGCSQPRSFQEPGVSRSQEAAKWLGSGGGPLRPLSSGRTISRAFGRRFPEMQAVNISLFCGTEIETTHSSTILSTQTNMFSIQHQGSKSERFRSGEVDSFS